MDARVAKEFQFHAAHRLRNHDGKCRNLHGHTYTVRVEIAGPVSVDTGTSGEGMVIDFDRVKEAWKPLEVILDHRTILDASDELVAVLTRAGQAPYITQVNGPPTAEMLAAIILNRIPMASAVRVNETPTSWAEVRR